MSGGQKDYMNDIELVQPITTKSREEAVQDLWKWKILRNVPKVLLRQVRYATVARRFYDSWADYAVMITDDDQAYVIGDNQYGQLGVVGSEKYLSVAIKVEELSGLGIVGFSTSWTMVSAWTHDGKLFMMGSNNSGQLGQGHQKPLALPQQVFKESNVKVVKAACGGSHTLCLAANGNVYAWGRNSFRQCNSVSVYSVTAPMQIKFPVDGIKTVDVACTMNSSFALHGDGHLYGWGNNTNGALGTGSTEKVVTNPTLIAIPDNELVKMVSCGYNHCIVLTTQGTVFVWGSNNKGQLGTGVQDNACRPVKVDIANIISISATNGISNTVCATLGGSIFAWGHFIEAITPKQTEFANINDCRAHYELGMSETWVSNCEISKVEPDCSAFLTIYADTKKIAFQVDGKTITASKVYMLRCKFFQEKLKGAWKQEMKTNGVIEITEVKAKHFSIFVNFLHTDRLQDTAREDLIDLLKLAHTYKMERFRLAVTDLVKAEMTIGNVIQLYSAALDHKDEALHLEIMNFIRPRVSEILDQLDLTAVGHEFVMKLLADLKEFKAPKSN